ncbi:MAG TPA: S41 family peptidase [Bacteroidales bacterium]|nr:S41 family peptidase [Bacteroidales bacterium]
MFIGLQLGQTGIRIPVLHARQSDKLKEVVRYVEDNYVDTLSRETVNDKAISGLLHNLDPHSVYISASEYHEYTDPLLGSFEGIGVRFQIERDTVMVITPVSGGPSERIGIRAGDRIVKIDGKNVAGIHITNNEVMKKLKGEKGTKVSVSIFRRGVQGLLSFTITRDVIPTYSVDIAYMADPVTGYIRLNNFSETTPDEIAKSLTDLRAAGMKKLILDLRGNGGGYLKAAIDLADELLPSGKLIVYTQGAHHPKEVSYSGSGGLFEQGDLAILIDEYSASASEIVAGAIQDNDRGLIIGRRSFGKGLVQEQMNFGDGSAIRLTVARYYTPTGRCIQRSYKNGSDDDYTSYYHQLMTGEEENPDSIKFPDSLKFKTPKGKIVYGGGGIMPDIYIPAEKDTALAYYNLAINKGTVYQFALDFTDRNRKALSRFRTFRDFDRDFNLTEAQFNDFIAFATKQGIKRGTKNYTASDQRIRVMIKAYVGRNILDNDGFFPLLNRIDPTFLKAMAVLEKKDR